MHADFRRWAGLLEELFLKKNKSKQRQGGVTRNFSEQIFYIITQKPRLEIIGLSKKKFLRQPKSQIEDSYSPNSPML